MSKRGSRLMKLHLGSVSGCFCCEGSGVFVFESKVPHFWELNALALKSLFQK